MNIDRAKLQRKSDALIELLKTHQSVYVHIDSRFAGVVLPKEFMGRPQVALQLGSNLIIPMQDFSMNALGWSVVLSFTRTAFRCQVPWGAVYLIVGDSGIGASWPNDTPTEAVVRRTEEKAATAPPGAAIKRSLPPGWKVIEGGAGAAPAASQKAKPKTLRPKPKSPRGPYRRPGPEAG